MQHFTPLTLLWFLFKDGAVVNGNLVVFCAELLKERSVTAMARINPLAWNNPINPFTVTCHATVNLGIIAVHDDVGMYVFTNLSLVFSRA